MGKDGPLMGARSEISGLAEKHGQGTHIAREREGSLKDSTDGAFDFHPWVYHPHAGQSNALYANGARMFPHTSIFPRSQISFAVAPPQSKRNTNSVAYDPITLKYNDSEDGKRLLFSDQHVRYRAALRAKFLNDKMCTNDYNIITGGDLSTTNLPSKPTMERPSFM